MPAPRTNRCLCAAAGAHGLTLMHVLALPVPCRRAEAELLWIMSGQEHFPPSLCSRQAGEPSGAHQRRALAGARLLQKR